MGHYNSDATSKRPLTEETMHVYESFKKHCSAERVNTGLEILVAIRERHPESHVTVTNPRKCDLLGFANAGHLKAALHAEGDNFQTKRTYTPPATRLDGGDGSLGETVRFGFFDAEYHGEAFNFYMAVWKNEVFGRETEELFILSAKSSLDAAGHSAWADALVLAASKWTVELHDEIYVYDAADWTKSSQLWRAVQNSSWDDVIIDPKMKETLISDVQNFFDSRAVYEEYSVPWKRGIILHGTPGCGKTISIKALMNALDKREQPVASLYVKTFTTSCPGEEYSIREIFEKARVMAPCMLVFEDLDSLVKDKIRSYFLNEVDGLEDNNGILMVGSTNHLERLDPGIAKRPSRFDRKYHYKLPAYDERILYCEYWKKKLERNSKIDFDPAISDVVAKLTDGFSFAYLKELFVQTLLTIVGGRNRDAEESEVDDAAEKSKVIEGSASLVVGKGKVDSNGTNTEVKDEDEKAAEKSGESKNDMPDVEVPEALKDNALMRILHKQCISLWNDMDNSEDPEAGVKKEKKTEEEEEEEKKGCGCC